MSEDEKAFVDAVTSQRIAALDLALRLHPHGSSAERVAADATVFNEFLNGQNFPAEIKQ